MVSVFPLFRERRTGAWLAPGRCAERAHLISLKNRLASMGHGKQLQAAGRMPPIQPARTPALFCAAVWLLVFLLLLSISVSAFADNKRNESKPGAAAASSREVLRGIVRDESGAALAGAEVHLR